jgi:hypothetical protein
MTTITSEGTVVAPLDFPGLVRSTVAVVGVLFFATGFDLYGFEQYSTPNPTTLNLAMAALLGALMFADLKRLPRFATSPLTFWILGWVAITAIWSVLVGSVPGRNELLERLKAIFLLATMVAAFDDPRARKAGAYALAAAVVIMAVCNVTELTGLIEFKKGLQEVYAKQRVEGRASGFIYNSNEAGRSIALAAAIAFWWVPRHLRLPLLVIGAVGAVVTFSRGSLILYAVFVAWAFWRREVTGWPALLALGILGLVVVVWLGGHAQAILEPIGAWNDDTAMRINITDWASDDSGRGALLAGAWADFLRSPVLGHPYGDAEIMAPHNMYVAFAIDHGVTGLLILPALALALFRCDRRLVPFSLMLLAAGFFSHVLLLEHTAIVAIALAGAGLPPSEPRRVRRPLLAFRPRLPAP